MADEWMTNEERFEAAIALDTVDRHPVFPILVTTIITLCSQEKCARPLSAT
ncbi:MAG: hypothetical protein JRF52_10305 [Deltaproteobacteria bacterium]|nr:hypothetical protein [Deltaproteobacteria bacterium]